MIGGWEISSIVCFTCRGAFHLKKDGHKVVGSKDEHKASGLDVSKLNDI